VVNNVGKETKCNVKFESFWNIRSCRLLIGKGKTKPVQTLRVPGG